MKSRFAPLHFESEDTQELATQRIIQRHQCEGVAVKVAELLDSWARTAPDSKTAQSYAVRLSLEDAARLHALADLFPGRAVEDFITDLLTVALREVEAAMPYRPGTQVIARDEQGDPIYEDIGLTPRFEKLIRKHKEQLSRKP